MKLGIRIMQANFAAMMTAGLDPEVKKEQAHMMNKATGGYLFSPSPIPHKYRNQRQRRKTFRQSLHPKNLR